MNEEEGLVIIRDLPTESVKICPNDQNVWCSTRLSPRPDIGDKAHPLKSWHLIRAFSVPWLLWFLETRGGSFPQCVCFIATDTAGRPLHTTLRSLQDPCGWMTSAAQERKPASFSVPGGSGEHMTAAIGRTWLWPATPAARDTGRLWVRTAPLCASLSGWPRAPPCAHPQWEASRIQPCSLFATTSSFSVLCFQRNNLLSLPTTVIKFILLKWFYFYPSERWIKEAAMSILLLIGPSSESHVPWILMNY